MCYAAALPALLTRRGVALPRFAALPLLLAALLLLPAAAPVVAQQGADDEAPAGDEATPPAADETVIPLPVGTEADLSVTSVGPVWDVASADSTYIAIADQGLWLLQADGKTIQRVPAPADMLSFVATDGTTYFVGSDSGLYAGRHEQWERRVEDVVFALCIQQNPRRYVAAAWNGMWRSEDGVQWSRAEFPKLRTFQCLIDGQTVYAATTSGLYRSSDAGQTWVKASSGLDPFVAGIALSATRLYAATGGGLYVSDDGAESWRRVSSPLPALQEITVEAGVISIMNEGQVFRSADAGETWLSEEGSQAIRLKGVALAKDVEARQ